MNRIPESELMDDPAQAQAYAQTDFSEPHNAFVQYFRERFPDFRGGDVIDLGCGAADVTIRYAQAYPRACVTAIDGAQTMLELAQRAVAREHLASRITLERCRLPATALPKTGFDAVICNSLLHHLDDPCVLWQTVKQISKSGAAVMVMDLLRPASREQAKHLVRLHAAGAPPILLQDFYNSLRAAYLPKEVHGQLDQSGLGHFRVEVVSDHHMLIWGVAGG